MHVDPPELHPLAQAQVDAHAVTAPKDDAAARARVVDLLEHFETDIAPLVRPVVQGLLDDPATPDQLRPLLSMVAQPEHFGESIIIGIAIGAILSPVLSAATAPLVQSIGSTAWIAAANSGQPILGTPLSPALLAEATLKNAVPGFDKQAEAAFSGIDASRFGLMVAAAGNAPGLAEALLLERRNQWVGTDLDAALRYSNYNDIFIASLKNLKYAPLSAGEVITAALKGHMTDAVAQPLLGVAGIDPQYYPVLKASAGRPPGIDQMLQLWNLSTAGLIQTAVGPNDVQAAVQQSDINDTYLPFIDELRHYFPPPRSIVPMLRSGGINETQARQLLTGYGVGEPWATAFVTEAHTTKTGAVKDLTQSQVTALYEAQLIPRATAQTRIEAVGYSATDAGQLLDLADERHTKAQDDAVVRLIGNRYVTRKITKAQAVTQLNAIPIPASAQAPLFHLWDIELAITVHHLTPGQVVGAYRRTEITAAECKTRLIALGVQEADLAILVADGWPPTKGAAAVAAATAVVNA